MGTSCDHVNNGWFGVSVGQYNIAGSTSLPFKNSSAPEITNP
ncbi:hypothetical protein [Mycobacterium basiliense]|nr:hypothetical protein [Mycobacterium basiliense]